MKPIKQFTFIIIFIFALPVLTTLSCKKQPINWGGITANATVIDTGNPMLDGCGWLIDIDGTNDRYSPTNLPDSYKTANLKVHISYKILLTRFQCGMVANNGFTQIQLDAIVKQ
jgi:hypothetical protein